MRTIARNIMMAAAVTLAATPALATPVSTAANPAASLSVAKSVRAEAPARRGSKLAHNTAVFGVVALIIATGIVLAITLPSDNSTSP